MNHINPLQQAEPVPVFQDQFGRNKRKLRISVTDRCNFKCVYCMPEHPEWMKKHDLLSFEELYHFVNSWFAVVLNRFGLPVANL